MRDALYRAVFGSKVKSRTVGLTHLIAFRPRERVRPLGTGRGRTIPGRYKNRCGLRNVPADVFPGGDEAVSARMQRIASTVAEHCVASRDHALRTGLSFRSLGKNRQSSVPKRWSGNYISDPSLNLTSANYWSKKGGGNYLTDDTSREGRVRLLLSAHLRSSLILQTDSRSGNFEVRCGAFSKSLEQKTAKLQLDLMR
jgi:hypothetical protein